MRRIYAILLLFFLSQGFVCAEELSDTTINILKETALSGSITSTHTLMGLYHDGKIVKKDYNESFKWALHGAKLGDGMCQYYTAAYYQIGMGVEKDSDKALEWALLAAEQNIVKAQTLVSALYVEKRPQNIIEAAKWIIIAYKNGDKKSEPLLVSLQQGMTESDFKKSEKAAEIFLKSRN